MCERGRERSSNFSIKEIRLLIDLVIRNKNIIENKASDAVNLKQKSDCWEKMCILFNASNLVQRNVKTLKLKYESVKKILRKKLAEEKRCLYGTGGGPKKNINLEDYEEKLHSIIKLTVEGLESRGDGDAVFSSDNIVTSHEEHEEQEAINLESLQVENNLNICNYDLQNQYQTDEPQIELEILDEAPLPIIEASGSDLNKKFNIKKSNVLYSNKKEKISTATNFNKLAEVKKKLVEIQIENLLKERDEKNELRKNEIKKQEIEMDILLKEHNLKVKLLELEIEKKNIEISLLR